MYFENAYSTPDPADCLLSSKNKIKHSEHSICSASALIGLWANLIIGVTSLSILKSLIEHMLHHIDDTEWA